MGMRPVSASSTINSAANTSTCAGFSNVQAGPCATASIWLRLVEPAAMATVNKGRDITLTIAEMISSELEEMSLNPAAFELAAFAIFGTAASATDWWLGADNDSPRRMASDEFIRHMTTIMMGAINGTAELLGVKIDADGPIRTAVRRQQPVA